MGTKRVLVLDHTAQLGGAEIALTRLVGALDREQFDVSAVLFADGPLADRLRGLGVRVRVIELAEEVATADRRSLLLRPASLGRAALEVSRHVRRLATAVRGEGIDLVVANSLKSAVLGAAAAALARRPFVWHLHDRLSDDYLPRPVATAMRTLARHGVRHVVVNSTATLACLEPIDPRRVTIAYPGLPDEDFARQERPARSSVPVPGPVVGMLGRISPTKGQDVLVRAAALLLAQGREVSVRIVGEVVFNETHYADQVRRLARDLGLDPAIVFAGWSGDPEREVRGFDVLVHASPVPEPFGQVIVEAMAAGVPVVATKGGGATEILAGSAGEGARVERTALGQLVRRGDPDALATAVAWSLDNRAESLRMAEDARRSALDRFTITRTAAVVARAWSSALGA